MALELPTPLRAPPIPETDILSLLFDAPATNYDPETVIFQDDVSHAHLTWSRLKKDLCRFGGGLRTKAGVERGDSVLILATHGLHYPVIMFGALCAGARVVPVNPALLADDIVKYVDATNSKTIIVGQQFLATAEAVKTKHPQLQIIEIDNGPKTSSRYLTYSKVLESDSIAWPRGPETNQSTALICFSSGTSGLPKGCLLSHTNLVANMHIYYHGTHSPGKSRQIILAAFPPFHIAGIWGSMISPIYNGNLQILLKSFTLPLFLVLLTKYKPTELSMAPPLILVLATLPVIETVDFTSVQKIAVGAAPLSEELTEKCLTRLRRLGARNLKIVQVWGMTEGSCCMTAYHDDDHESLKYGGVGFTLPHLSLKLVHSVDENKTVEAGESGEILVKGPSIFQGYLDIDNAQFFTADGYYRTGDIGVSDAAGRLKIVDRIKELIKVSGYQVAPAELEGLLLTHPDIDDAAVIGVPFRNNTTERPRAYIVLNPTSKLARQHPELSRKQIHHWFNGKVVTYKRLTGGIRILKPEKGEVIPKSPSGKLLRRLLRDQSMQELTVPAKL